MNIILSNSSNEPIYAQIEAQVKQQIMSGELSPGETLPSMRTLASQLRISVITTKRAYEELERDGFIEKISGTQNNLPRTDYLLTEEGEKLIPILKEIYKWGLHDMKKKDLYIDPRTYDYL